MSDKHVQGFCPMGCGETLFAALDGYITCGSLACPNPTAVSDILLVRETEHLVELGETTFNVLHPLRERVNDQVLSCDLADYLASLDGPPPKPGRYRVTRHEDGWNFAEASR